MNPGTRSKTFEGFQTEDRTIQALPIRIDYQSPRYEHFMRPIGDDWLLSFSMMKGQWNSGKVRETTNLDPYEIRDAFETIETAEQAVRFLSESGRFWPFEQILWSEFREWQAFFSWLRLEPAQAKKATEGKRAWDTAVGLGSAFFAQSDAEFTRSRFPEDAINEFGSDRWREIQSGDRQRLRCLRHFALQPERPGEGNRVSLNWYDPTNEHPPEDWKARHKATRKSAVLEPFLRVEALNVIEAIAATIFADRANGTKFGKCKHCGRIFKVESDHGQIFCPAPPHLQTSPCKNAHLQSERRKNEKDAIELLLSAWRSGVKESRIKEEAEAQKIRITSQAVAKAKRKYQPK